MNPLDFIALNIGNTRTQIGRFSGGELDHVERVGNEELAPVVQAVMQTFRELEDDQGTIIIASVNEPFARRLHSALEDQLAAEMYRIGEDLPLPISIQLDPETITGVDRLLNAAAAYAQLKQACIIVDAGTAVTVDFVDGAGTFQGGAIAPGVRMQLRALHEQTSALPSIEYRQPDDEAFGKNTAQAMLQGVHYGVRGLVWRLVEHYAQSYGAFPQVIATGGDAEALFADDELINRIVPNLTLLGMAEAVRRAVESESDEIADHGDVDHT